MTEWEEKLTLEIMGLREEIENLHEQVAYLMKWHFGKSSEKNIMKGQLNLFEESNFFKTQSQRMNKSLPKKWATAARNKKGVKKK